MYCRWRDNASLEWVAAKHMSDSDLAQQELAALEIAHHHNVPRIVRLIENIKLPLGKTILVLE